MPNIRKGKEIMQEISFDSVGIGTPGLIDSERGICISAGNLPYNHTPIVAKLKEAINKSSTCKRCYLCVAWRNFGRRRKKYRDFIMITLGTGVGGGICIDGKPYCAHNIPFAHSGTPGQSILQLV